MSSAIADLEDAAETLSGTLGESDRGAGAAAAAAHRSTDGFQAVAAVAETLTGIIAEGAARALSGTEFASTHVRQLADAAREIGTVADSISEAAIQTNMLALDAIIEASRGEGAGPGAALVANRINNLANQTTQATERITARIGENHRAAEDAVGAVASIAEIVSDIDYSAAALAAAVDRQRHTALDIARNAHRATIGSSEASGSVTAVAAGGVSRHAAGLHDQVGKVVETLRGGG